MIITQSPLKVITGVQLGINEDMFINKKLFLYLFLSCLSCTCAGSKMMDADWNYDKFMEYFHKGDLEEAKSYLAVAAGLGSKKAQVGLLSGYRKAITNENCIDKCGYDIRRDKLDKMIEEIFNGSDKNAVAAVYFLKSTESKYLEDDMHKYAKYLAEAALLEEFFASKEMYDYSKATGLCDIGLYFWGMVLMRQPVLSSESKLFKIVEHELGSILIERRLSDELDRLVQQSTSHDIAAGEKLSFFQSYFGERDFDFTVVPYADVK